MHYLADLGIILLVSLLLVAASWWMADARNTLLENTVLGASALLGLLAWFFGVVKPLLRLPFGFPLWSVLIPALFFVLVPFGIPTAERLHSFKTRTRSAWEGVLGLRGTERALALYLLFLGALTLFLSLAPPGANDYDSLVYHLSAPARYLADGRISELPYDHHTYFPFAMEMLFALGLQWSGSVLAKLFHWLMLPLSCLAILAIGQKHLSLRAGLFGAALFATIPIVLIESTTAYIDLGLTLFVLVAFLCFLNWLDTRETRWLALCGLMCGFACSTKYFGVLFFGWLLLWAVGDMAGRRRFALRPLLAFCFLTALFGGYYYIRNWIWVGNPVFPFAYEIFGGKGWTLEMAKAYTRDQEAFGFGRAPLDWLLLPFRAIWTPFNFAQPFWPLSALPLENPDVVGRFEVPGHLIQTIIGPTLLAFGAPVVFIKRKPQAVRFLLWSFLFFWVFWAATSQQLRYLIPNLGLLSVAGGWGIVRMESRSAFLRWTVAVALTAWLVFVPALTAWRLRDVVPVVLGEQTPQEFLSRAFAGFDAMTWASKNTPPDAVFAVYGEPRNFYLKRKYFWADHSHHTLIDYPNIHNGEQLIEALKKQGATHLLWNTRAAQNGGFGGPPDEIEEALEQKLLTELYEARGYRVFQLKRAGS